MDTVYRKTVTNTATKPLFRRITRPAVVSLAVAGIGLISLVGLAGYELTVRSVTKSGVDAINQFFFSLLSLAWGGIPYLGIAVLIAVFGRRQAASIAVLVVTVLITCLGEFAYEAEWVASDKWLFFALVTEQILLLSCAGLAAAIVWLIRLRLAAKSPESPRLDVDRPPQRREHFGEITKGEGRRWFLFTLGTLLVLLPVLMLVFGKMLKYWAVVWAIVNLGGEVEYDETFRSPCHPVVSVSLINSGATDMGLAHLQGFTQLQTLNLRGTRVTDAGVKKLDKALPNVKIER